MLCQTFESVLVPYRTVAEVNEDHWLPAVEYNTDILGGDGFECINTVNGLFFDTAGGSYTDSGKLVVAALTAQRWWPGWNVRSFEFDAESGAFVGLGASVGGSNVGATLLRDISQGVQGELWVRHQYGHAILLDQNYALTSVTLTPSLFGVTAFRGLLVDRMRDRVVLSDTAGSPSVRVHSLSTGALISSISLPEAPVDICHEEGTRCYVLTASRDVFVLDYATGSLFGAVKLTTLYSMLGTSSSQPKIAWDKRYRRLLAVEQPALPIGFTSSTKIVGFAMRPVATHLCTPIPLKRLRAGASVPFLLKTVGDLGEGIPSGVTVAVAGPASSSPRNIVATDGAGEAIVDINAVSAGSDAITTTTDVPCQP